MASYPKVLIIGDYFTTQPGNTITLSNLFKGWDKNNLAVAAYDIKYPDFDICDNFFQLGSTERKYNFPFNLKFNKPTVYSGVLSKIDKEKQEINNFSGEKALRKSPLIKLYYKLLVASGLEHIKSNFIISEKFKSWVNEFAPDIIYSQLSNLEVILFVKELNEKFQIPVAIHIMDDWPSTIGKNTAFKLFWNQKINKEFKSLLNKASVFMSISETMSEEYYTRYSKKFYPFHNPVDLDFWGESYKQSYKRNAPFVILYIGRIGTGIRNCFYEIAEAIKMLVSQGYNIELQLQITNRDHAMESLSKFGFIKFNKLVPYELLPGKLSNADVLLLPNDFDEEARPFLKYSMPTKASEYMISGTPILLYAEKEAAVTMHANKYHWAYVVSENKKELIMEAIINLYDSEDLRMNLGTRAKLFAQQEYDEHKIRKKFKEAFTLN